MCWTRSRSRRRGRLDARRAGASQGASAIPALAPRNSLRDSDVGRSASPPMSFRAAGRLMTYRDSFLRTPALGGRAARRRNEMPEHTIGTREEWQAARDELAKLEAEHAARGE